MNCEAELCPLSAQTRCKNCGQPYAVDRVCPAEETLETLLAMHRGDAPPRAVVLTSWQAARVHELVGAANLLTPAEQQQIFGDDKPLLLGARLKQLFEAVGVPPCPGCESRAAWLDRADAYAREFFRGLAT